MTDSIWTLCMFTWERSVMLLCTRETSPTLAEAAPPAPGCGLKASIGLCPPGVGIAATPSESRASRDSFSAPISV